MPRERIPGIPGGGIDLSQPTRPRGRTVHKTAFMGCVASFAAILSAENVCLGYRLQIHDPQEAHIYNFDFDQKLLDEFKRTLGEFPDQGTTVPTDGASGGNVVPFQ